MSKVMGLRVTSVEVFPARESLSFPFLAACWLKALRKAGGER